MILNGRLDSVLVQRMADQPTHGMVIDLRFTDVRDLGDNLEAAFEYTVDYQKGVGGLKMAGRLLVAPPSPAEKTLVLNSLRRHRSLPGGFAQEAINGAHYLCTINSPLATRMVDLSPPIAPMQINLSTPEPGMDQSNPNSAPGWPSSTQRSAPSSPSRPKF